MFTGWSLRLRVFLFFALLGLASLALIAGGLWLGYSRAEPAPDATAFVLGGTAAGFAVLGLVTWIWRLFDENLARPLQAMAAELRALAHAKTARAPDAKTAQYLGDLAPAAQAIAAKLNETRNDLALAIARETTRISEEKERLETLLADVNVGILLCSHDHTVVFYNSVARELLRPGNPPRLDQPVTGCLRQGPLLDALTRLTQDGAAHSETRFLASTPDGMALFEATMRLIRQGEAKGGYVLTLADITQNISLHSRREALLADMVEDMRRKAANLDTLGALREDGDPDPLNEALLQETRDLARAVDKFGARYNDLGGGWWPTTDIAARDLMDSLTARLRAQGITCTTRHEDLSVSCDGYLLVSLIASLAGHLPGPITLSLAPGTSGGEALLTLGHEGAPVPLGDLERWLAEPLDIGQSDLTGRFVLARHHTDIWPEADADGGPRLCLPLQRTEARGDHDLRGAVYDFGLFDRARAAPLADRALDDLSYVVFDTETTGLLPAHDEIVQIAALRVVGGRLQNAERLDTLVDPGCPIPEASTRIHGISDAMIAGAPGIADAGRELHDFAAGSVLVAHNAPFDLAFMHKHADVIERTFDNPVLDTVLLSAVLFGITEDHTLDGLCARLSVTIPEADRHTAMGDTQATAIVFLRMLEMLKGRGFETFGALHAEMKKQMRLYRRT